MQGSSIQRSGSRIAGALACLMLFLSCPQHSRAWGRNGHRLVVNKAIDTLPQDIRPFFESNLALLSQHVTDPLDTIAKSPPRSTTISFFSISMGDSLSTPCLETTKRR